MTDCRHKAARFLSKYRKIVVGQWPHDITLTNHYRLQLELSPSDTDVNTLSARRIGHERYGRSKGFALCGMRCQRVGVLQSPDSSRRQSLLEVGERNADPTPSLKIDNEAVYANFSHLTERTVTDVAVAFCTIRSKRSIRYARDDLVAGLEPQITDTELGSDKRAVSAEQLPRTLVQRPTLDVVFGRHCTATALRLGP
jgi:hypothetical protein